MTDLERHLTQTCYLLGQQILYLLGQATVEQLEEIAEGPRRRGKRR